MNFLDGRDSGIRLAVMTALLFSISTAVADYDRQPQNNHSTLIGNDRKTAVRDDEFAQWMKDLLLRNGQRSAHNAIFLFQQCFSGGMLDNLVDELGGRVPWVGGAAARHDRLSFGELPNARDRRPEGYWTEELRDQLRRNQSVFDALRNTKRQEGARTVEFPQFLKRGEGSENIKVDKRGVTSRHAILWAGDVSRGGDSAPDQVHEQLYFNNIQNMYRLLRDKWGRPDGRNITISVLFGNGRNLPRSNQNLPDQWHAQPATRENLQAAINALKDGNANNGEMNPNEQFFFYSTDHGGHQVEKPQPRRVGSNTNHRDTFEVPEGVQTAMLTDINNEPTLSIDYSGVTIPGAVPVLWNNSLLGYLDPSTSQMEFPIPESLISLENMFEVVNNTPTDILLERCVFDSGGIGSDMITIPEPASVLALLTGVGGLLLKRKKG